MKRKLGLLLINLPLCLFAQHSLQFIGEDIDFAINKDRFSVNGIYYFTNRTSTALNQNILFPFSENTDSIDIGRIYNLTYSENVKYQFLKSAILFKIFLLPEDTIQLNIAYSQKSEDENIYILESAQSWDEPLIHAVYTLTFDGSIQIDSLSMEADSLVDNVYYWSRQNFIPDDDFTVWVKEINSNPSQGVSSKTSSRTKR